MDSSRVLVLCLQVALKQVDEGIADMKAAQELEPGDKGIAAAITAARSLIDADIKKQKAAYAKMFK